MMFTRLSSRPGRMKAERRELLSFQIAKSMSPMLPMMKRAPLA